MLKTKQTPPSKTKPTPASKTRPTLHSRTIPTPPSTTRPTPPRLLHEQVPKNEYLPYLYYAPRIPILEPNTLNQNQESLISGNPNNLPPAPKPAMGGIPPILQGAKSREKNQKVQTPPKVKIEAPLHDLADLIHNAISGSSRDESESGSIPDNLSNLPDYLNSPVLADSQIPRNIETYQASIPEEINDPYGLESIPTFSHPVSQVPEKSIYDRLNETLNSPPLLSEHQPSKLRRIGGAIVGGLTGAAYGPERGVEQARNIVEKPYRESYQDWLTKSGALEKEANIGLKRGEIELNRRKIESGIGSDEFQNVLDYFNYQRQKEKDEAERSPEAQANLAGAKTAAEEKAKESGRVAEDERELTKNLILEDIRKTRDEDLAKFNQGEISKRTDKEIASREKMARAQINSRENIAKLARDLRKTLAEGKNQRVPPNQQYLAGLMAENEVSRTIVNQEEYKNIFDPIYDDKGRVSGYKLKPDNEVPAKWKSKYDDRKKQVDLLKSQILKNSFDPSANDDIGIDDELDTSDITIKEIQ